MPVNFRPCCNKIIKSQRHQKALEYALEQIRASSIAPYVNAVYLNTMPFYENIRKEGILIWP